jgi:hypothetical protein
VDPFYLSWKAKEWDFRTRFIELAGEIKLAVNSSGKESTDSNVATAVIPAHLGVVPANAARAALRRNAIFSPGIPRTRGRLVPHPTARAREEASQR